MLALGVLASVTHLHALAADPLAPQIGRAVDGRAVVTGLVTRGQWDERAIARFQGADVLLRATAPLETGDVIELRGHLRAPHGPAAGGFDERHWLARQGVHEVLRASDATVVGRRGGAWGVIDRSAARRAGRCTSRAATARPSPTASCWAATTGSRAGRATRSGHRASAICSRCRARTWCC